MAQRTRPAALLVDAQIPDPDTLTDTLLAPLVPELYQHQRQRGRSRQPRRIEHSAVGRTCTRTATAPGYNRTLNASTRVTWTSLKLSSLTSSSARRPPGSRGPNVRDS